MVVIENKDYSYRYLWMTSICLEQSRIWNPCGRNFDLDEPTTFLDHVHVGSTQRECTLIKKCSNHEFLLEHLKNYQGGRDFTPRQSRGPTTWKGMRKSALIDIASWQTKRLSSCAKSQLLVWTTTTSRRRNWKRLENCQTKTRGLFGDDCICHELVELTFFGP